MKTILRLTAVSMALALSGAIACGGSSGCGGTTANNATTVTPVTCGSGTVQQGGQCVPVNNVQTN